MSTGSKVQGSEKRVQIHSLITH